MANSYTDRLIKRMPAPGDYDWDDEWHDNEKIDDYVAGGLLSSNRVVSGGVVSDGGGLDVDYTAMVVYVGGKRYSIPAGSVVSLAPSSLNFIYIDDSGTVGFALAVPAGVYLPLAIVDTGTVAITRIGDVRPMAAASVPGENIFINGDMSIDQENEGAAVNSVGASAAYFLDMFKFAGTDSGAVIQAQRVAGFGGFDYAAQLKVTTAAALATGKKTHAFLTYVEYANAVALKDRNLIIRFSWEASVAGDYSVAVLSGDTASSYVTKFTYDVADTAQVIELTIPIPASSVTDGTNNRGLHLYVGMSAYSDHSQVTSTLNVWQTGVFLAATGCADWQATLNNTIAMTGLQGGIDLLPTGFPYQPIDRKLVQCSRYYQKSYLPGVVPGTITDVGAEMFVKQAPNSPVYCQFSTDMRTTPAVATYSTALATAGYVRNENLATDVAVTSIVKSPKGIQGVKTTGGTDSHSFQWVADARM